MDRDRVLGTAKKAKGDLKRAAGELTGDRKLKDEGRADRAEGEVQNTVGGIKDAIRDKLDR